MRVILPAVLALFSLTACVQSSDPAMNETVTGAVAGGLIGAAVSDDGDRIEGALIGSAVGAAAGLLIGRTNDGRCRYRDSNGNEYTSACQ